ncbi:CDP-alcohol phosphatidyltransferase family protein [Thiorhodospira sibirica]|uniref:CDP-alcohol phosphatidyltransferase family protein n=1 Tax=Thiorhodospira sibirica TaxID=154347 RepID=UPI00022C2DD2|nr:CDP-alcohol phosphatidyltransferase family protein [Thiorhodospira sibirica]
MNWHYLPNVITIARIALALPIVWSLWQGQYALVLLLLFIAGLSDALDGWLARRYGWQSPLGAYLDPLADKVLMVATYFTVALTGLLPWWLVLAVVVRDLVIVAGAIGYRGVTKQLEMQPLLISKLNTFMQIVLVLSVIINAGVYPLPPLLLHSLIGIVLFTTLSSGAAYVWLWSRKTVVYRRKKNAAPLQEDEPR